VIAVDLDGCVCDGRRIEVMGNVGGYHWHKGGKVCKVRGRGLEKKRDQ